MAEYTITENITSSPSHTRDVARDVAQRLSGGDLVTLTGELGAGKTTFVQGLLHALGAEGPFTSPTFTIVRTYELPESASARARDIATLFHIDAYRITEDAILDIGWREMIANSQAVTLVEWPERIADVIPPHAKKITLRILDDVAHASEQRIITFDF